MELYVAKVAFAGQPTYMDTFNSNLMLSCMLGYNLGLSCGRLIGNQNDCEMSYGCLNMYFNSCEKIS